MSDEEKGRRRKGDAALFNRFHVIFKPASPEKELRPLFFISPFLHPRKKPLGKRFPD
jgi:hypothetical protein